MSLEKLLERIADGLEANATAQSEHTAALKAYVLKVEGGNVKSPKKSSEEDEEEEKPKGKAKKDAKPEKAAKGKKSSRDEDDDEDEDEKPKGKKSSRDEDDDEDEDEKPKGKKLSIDDVKEKLFEVRDDVGKKEAKAILDKFGYDTVGDVEPKDFEKLIAACEKALK